MLEELRHRGADLVEYPGDDLWRAVGGEEGVAALIRDLYSRIERHELLREVFPHFNDAQAAIFFRQWFGGPRDYSDRLEGGLLRRHHHRYISPRAAAAWLECMQDALFESGLTARGFELERIMRPLKRIAKAMIHNPETDSGALRKTCDAVQDERQVCFEAVLADVTKGRTANVLAALREDRTLARSRGEGHRSLVWEAIYRDRPKILEVLLNLDADLDSPACDLTRATLACDKIEWGTTVSVTPLAIARKWRPKWVAPLVEHGAIDDVFTAAWVGDPVALRGHLERNPNLAGAIDPADDFQETSVLCHAVAGGNRECVQLLLDTPLDWRGEVERQSGKLLTLAVWLNRLDLVELLIDRGADVSRVDTLGRLDDEHRPIADLLIAEGKRVPPWMLPRACRPDISSNEIHRVNVLLDYGAHVDDRGQYGLTALHYATRGGKLPLIRTLLERGASVAALDDEGLTPLLHLAKTRSKADPIPVMELLFAHGADLDARDESGRTLTWFFERRGQRQGVNWLLAHGAAPAVVLPKRKSRE